MVFNSTTKSIIQRSGTKWKTLWSNNPNDMDPDPDPGIEIPLPTGCDINIPQVRFAKYNLGADHALDNPKAQMEHLAENDFDALDARVYGGLYQWGRKGHTYAVNASNYTRYDGTENTVSEQTDNPDEDKFYYGSSDNWYNGGNPAADALLGNGYGVSNDFTIPDGGAVLYNGGYYQKPVKTDYDPCPYGFRVPTQDEWERLCAYDCNPISVGGGFNPSVSGTPTGKGLTWVPVVCNRNSSGKCVPSADWRFNISSGYAIYETAEWTNAGDEYKNGNISLHDLNAPDPLLFIPAAGERNSTDNIVRNTGNFGGYWSSTVDGDTGARSLYFRGANVNPNGSDRRAQGFSIRCVLE
jgi:hypothetical protein